MKNPALLALTFGFSVALTGFSQTASHAQLVQNSEGNYQQSESSSLYGDTNGFNPYNLIHMMRLGNKDSAQFQNSTSSNIDSAAANYRTRLLEYWRQQKQAETSAVEDVPEETMVPTPTENNL
ncbi:hypothetical protein FLX56_16365 [Synechococcus moorigangaii CMS01]|nr:hypothetical protein [Synechococcus moorigangaii CMS01]